MTESSRRALWGQLRQLDLEAIAAQLSELKRQAGIDKTIAVGELILNSFFDGSEAAWRDRRRKSHSVRRLAAHPDCPFSKSALYDAVAICIAARSLPTVQTFGHITAGHISAVLALEPQQRAELLSMAESLRWSVRKLRCAAIELRRASGERRGRPKLIEAAPVELRASLRRAHGLIDDLLGKSGELELEKAGALHCANELVRLGTALRRAATRG
ncbi:MAG: hypothetical protein ACOY0T_18180 [Myxococcota bacterium]